MKWKRSSSQGQAKVKGELEGALKQTETELFLDMQKRIDEYQKNFHYRLGELGEGRGPVSSF
jgi:hypothetical protein